MQNPLMTRRVRASLVAGVVGLAGVTYGSSQVAVAKPTGSVPQRAAATWTSVNGPELDPASGLTDVAAAGPRNAWAVGRETSAEDNPGYSLLEQWDGTRWKKVSLPEDNGNRPEGGLDGVSAGAVNDVWTVGSFLYPRAYHWNGTRWTGHNPVGTEWDTHYLSDVGTSGGNAWFVGSSRDPDPDNAPRTLIVGWKNGAFHTEPAAVPGSLNAVTVREKGKSAWAVGETADNHPLIMRWTGTAWETSPAPKIPQGKLNRVWQVTPDDVWAVGAIAPDNNDPSKPLILHWDGSSWTSVPVSFAQGELYGLTGDEQGRLWVSGIDEAKPKQVLFLRYDKGTWTRSYALTSGHVDGFSNSSVARVPGTTATWVVGTDAWGDHATDFIARNGSLGS